MTTFEGLDVTTRQNTRVTVSDGRVTTVEHVPQQEGTPDTYISRGFIDIQVNGYRGHDYSSDDFTKDDIYAMVSMLAASGTMRHVPTIITGPRETILKNLRIIAQTLAEDPQLRLSIPGVHLEGPHISPLDGARGAHSQRYVRKPDLQELADWQEAAQGAIKLVTLAPETEGAEAYIREAVKMGIRVAIGHSLAEPEHIDAAVKAGATLSTHLGNGSPAMLPRLINPIWSQLSRDELYASLISDGYHLPPAVLKVFARAKGLERIVLVSDVGTMGGLPLGRYHWGDTLVEVHPDGHLGVADTPYLAGAGHLLDHCIPVFMYATDSNLKDTIALVTTQPAHFLQLPDYTTAFQVGETADIVCFEKGAQQLNIKGAALGSKVYEA